jgi:hypothetical protein
MGTSSRFSEQLVVHLPKAARTKMEAGDPGIAPPATFGADAERTPGSAGRPCQPG